MLDARRYRAAAAHLGELLAASTACASARRRCPRTCAARSCSPPRARRTRGVLGEAIGRLLLMPPTISLRHIAVPRVTVAERLAHLRGAAAARALQLRRGRPRRRPHDRRGHAVRAARALQARRGRLGAGGELRRDRGPRPPAQAPAIAAAQAEGRPGERAGGLPAPAHAARGASEAAPTPSRTRPAHAVAALPLAHTIEALLFLSTDPLSVEELAEATQAGEGAVAGRARAARRGIRARAARDQAARARRRLDARERPRQPRRPPGACSAARAPPRSRPPRPRRSRSSPTCSPSRARRSPASAASAPTRPPPRCSSAA